MINQIKNKLFLNNKISSLVQDIINISKAAQTGAIRTVNAYLVIRNWLIGKRIDEEILTNRSNDYGKHLIENLSKELSKYGKGFSKRNLYNYLNFYIKYKKILQTVFAQSKNNVNLDVLITRFSKIQDNNNDIGHIKCSSCNINSENILNFLDIDSILPWTFYLLLINIDNENERDWYEKEAKKSCWSYRQLKRNIKTDYYHRVLSHQIEHKPNQLETIDSNDYLKPIYVFDFLNFKKNEKFKESELEQALLNHLKDFILELGKGYSFVDSQAHLRTNNKDYYVDLVFYNSIMKRNVLIDLKVGKIQHKDIGQMLIYLDLFDKQYKQGSDNSSIGIILSSDSNDIVVKYLAQHTNNHIVPSKYLTYLPTKDELKQEINKQIQLLK